MRLVQYASSEMRRYSTDRRAQAQLSGQYSVVNFGDTTSVLIHCGEAYPIGRSHNTTMRSLPKYLFPCYPECPNLGKYPQLVYPVMRVLRITAFGLTLPRLIFLALRRPGRATQHACPVRQHPTCAVQALWDVEGGPRRAPVVGGTAGSPWRPFLPTAAPAPWR
jgi:hypothetical protein